MSKVVLIVDDSDGVADSIAMALETNLGVRTIVAHHPRVALIAFEADRAIAVIVTDLSLPFLDGFELIGALRRLRPDERLPALMITAKEDPESLNTLVERRPDAILHKPFSLKEVCRVVQSLLQ